jgi:penicillin-binding protein 2
MPLFDKKDKSRYATFTRRSLGMAGGMTAVFAVLAGRLYQLQIRDGEQYLAEAEDNRVSERLLPPPRGRILDRFGMELANNRRNYRVLLVAEQATQGVADAVDRLAELIQISEPQKKRILATIAQNKKFVPVPVAENLTWEEFSRVNLHLPYLPGVQPDVGQTRDYPFGDEMVHLLGYVASVSPEDKAHDDDPLLDLPGYRIGKRGIEKQFETEVRGEAGASRVEVNANGRVVRELDHKEGAPGKDVWLTIDGELQKFAAQRLADQSAACVVLDVATGDVLALVSMPGYDPNEFNVGINGEQWRALTQNDHIPLLNKALGGIYPPGSTFKPVVAAAAIDAGLATSDYRVTCNGRLTLGGHTFNCWAWTTYHRGHGSLDVEGGIQHSCDVFFYETARRLGIDKIHETALKLGLGAPTGIELPGEHYGFIPSRDWKQKKYHVAWQQGDTLSAGVGQGYVTATPLQLAVEAARIASGRAVTPRLVHMVGNELRRRDPAAPIDLANDAFARVREGMNKVVNDPAGTAFAFRITEAGYEMAGKTGTAQVRVYSQAEHVSGVIKDTAIPWKLRDHGLFISFAPVASPRYACACITEHASIGHPQVTAVRDILLFAQKRRSLDMPTAYPVHSAALERALLPGREGEVR